MFNRDANHITVPVQIQVDIFAEFARFDGRIGGKFNQCGIGIFKVFDTHGLLLKISVKEGIVNGLAVLKQDHPQCAVFHFYDPRPTANSAIGLDFFTQWISNHSLDPFILYHSTIRTLASVLKVLRGLHLLRLYLKYKTISKRKIERAIATLNLRPRKTLRFKTPFDVFFHTTVALTA